MNKYKNKHEVTKWYGETEAARYLQMSQQALNKKRLAGKIKAYRFPNAGGRYFYKVSDLDEYIIERIKP